MPHGNQAWTAFSFSVFSVEYTVAISGFTAPSTRALPIPMHSVPDHSVQKPPAKRVEQNAGDVEDRSSLQQAAHSKPIAQLAGDNHGEDEAPKGGARDPAHLGVRQRKLPAQFIDGVAANRERQADDRNREAASDEQTAGTFHFVACHDIGSAPASVGQTIAFCGLPRLRSRRPRRFSRSPDAAWYIIHICWRVSTSVSPPRKASAVLSVAIRETIATNSRRPRVAKSTVREI